MRFYNFLSFQVSPGMQVGVVPLVERKKNQVSTTMSAHHMSHCLEYDVHQRPWNKETGDQQQNGVRENWLPLSSHKTWPESNDWSPLIFCLAWKRTQLWKSSARGNRKEGAWDACVIYSQGNYSGKKKKDFLDFIPQNVEDRTVKHSV